jgi:hypothetical protein
MTPGYPQRMGKGAPLTTMSNVMPSGGLIEC